MPGVRNSVVFTTIQSGGIASNGADTLLITSPPLNIPLDDAVVFIFYIINLQAGTGALSFTPHLRRGPLISSFPFSGASYTLTPVAGNFYNITGCYIDTPGKSAGVQYSVSSGAAGATGTSGIQDACIICACL